MRYIDKNIKVIKKSGIKKMLYKNSSFQSRNPQFQLHGDRLQIQTQIQRPQIIFSNHKLEHINCIFHQNQDNGGLFIGDTISTLKIQYVVNNNIQAVVCCNREAVNNVQMIKLPLQYKYYEIQDHIQFPIRLYFSSAIEFIDRNIRSKKNVLVQCHGGVSRSATIILAYLIKIKKLKLEDAYLLVKQKRFRAKPNQGFWKQLEEFQKWEGKDYGGEAKEGFVTPVKEKCGNGRGYQTRESEDRELTSSQKKRYDEQQNRYECKSNQKQQVMSTSAKNKNGYGDEDWKSESDKKMENKGHEVFYSKEKNKKDLRKSQNIQSQPFFQEAKFRTPPTNKTYMQSPPYPQIPSLYYPLVNHPSIYYNPSYIISQHQPNYLIQPPQPQIINSINYGQRIWRGRGN